MRSVTRDTKFEDDDARVGLVHAHGPAGVDRDKRASATGEVGTLARTGSVSVASMVVNGVLVFLFTGVVSHALPIDASGVMFELIALATIGGRIAVLGADSAAQRYVPTLRGSHSPDLPRVILGGVLPPIVLATGVSVATWFEAGRFAIDLSHGYEVHKVEIALRIMAACLPFLTGSMVLLAGLTAWSIPRSTITQNVVVPALSLGIIVVLWEMGLSLTSAALAWACPTLVGFLIGLFYVRRYLSKESGPRADRMPWPAIANYWSFAAPRSLATLFSTLTWWLDVVLVGLLGSTREAAGYSVVGRYLQLGILALSGVVTAIAPQMSRLIHGGDRRAARAVFQAASGWVVILTWPVLLTMAIYANGLLALFGHGYKPAGVALTIVALAMLANTATGPNGIALLMSGRSATNMAIACLGLEINVGLNFILIPRHGDTGAAIAWLVTIVVVTALTAVLLWRATGIHPFCRSWWISVGVASIGAVPELVSRLVLGQGAPSIILGVSVGIVVWCVAAVLFRKTIGFDDAKVLLRGLRR
jgi:O-antigen/teichoic acid export membrane protein